MKYFPCLLIVLITSACSNYSSQRAKALDTIENVRTQQQVASQIPANLRAKKDFDKEFPSEAPTPSGFDDIFEGQDISAGAPAPSHNDISDDELVWTDPDNPDQNLGEVEQAFSKPIKDSWQLSYQAAQRLALAEGKPLLIWFTNSRNSPICKRLDGEVFGTHEFEQWSKAHIVKLRVDLYPTDKNSVARNKKIKYAQALRNKFKIRGNPTVLMINHQGQTFGRYPGYRAGESSFYLGRLKHASQVINDHYFDWLPKMKKAGYRNWKGQNGVELFAKLINYQDGTLAVVEPNGRKTYFNESNLSASDQKWITKQKEQSSPQ